MLGGVVGIYYCVTDFPSYSKSTKAFIVKVRMSVKTPFPSDTFLLNFNCYSVCNDSLKEVSHNDDISNDIFQQEQVQCKIFLFNI